MRRLMRGAGTAAIRSWSAPVVYFTAAAGLAAYFAYAAVEGEHGLRARGALDERAATLRAEAAGLADRVAEMENLTHRLSDDYLDLDLLDERARKVLGLVRAEEIVIQ